MKKGSLQPSNKTKSITNFQMAAIILWSLSVIKITTSYILLKKRARKISRAWEDCKYFKNYGINHLKMPKSKCLDCFYDRISIWKNQSILWLSHECFKHLDYSYNRTRLYCKCAFYRLTWRQPPVQARKFKSWFLYWNISTFEKYLIRKAIGYVSNLPISKYYVIFIYFQIAFSALLAIPMKST